MTARLEMLETLRPCGLRRPSIRRPHEVLIALGIGACFSPVIKQEHFLRTERYHCNVLNHLLVAQGQGSMMKLTVQALLLADIADTDILNNSYRDLHTVPGLWRSSQAPCRNNPQQAGAITGCGCQP